MVQIETVIDEHISWVLVDGEIDASSSIQLDECLNLQLENRVPNISVDCTNLHYISSAGLGVFMSYIEDYKLNNQKFVLFGLSEKVKNVFDMLGLDQLMNIVSTKQDAIYLINEE